ncbi:hypothetical protein [Nostoc sp.]
MILRHQTTIAHPILKKLYPYRSAFIADVGAAIACLLTSLFIYY